jgi:hypothetical protein
VRIALGLLADANSWAQHFSNVRLVVATVLSVACFGTMTLKWHHPEPVFVWSTLGAWLLGLAFFVIISIEEWRKLDQRRRNVRALRALERGETYEREETDQRYQGWKRLTHEWFRQRDWAYAVYLVLTVVLLCAWSIWFAALGTAE